MKKLILIRHGQTDYTAKKRYCGQEDIPLNINGMVEAKRLKGKLKGIKIDRIYSSDLARAFQTAKIAFPNRVILKRKALREIDFGKFSGLTYDELAKKYPVTYEAWLKNPEKAQIPKGESLPRLASRVERCFRKISLENPAKTVTIVSHGGPIRVLLLKILKEKLDRFWSIKQSTAAVNIIKFKNGVPKKLWVNLPL